MADIGLVRHNPDQKSISATPIMDTQLDELAIAGVLTRLCNEVLQGLLRAFKPKDKKRWYEAFLVTFILLHNMEQVLDDVVDFEKRCGLQVSVFVLVSLTSMSPAYILARSKTSPTKSLR